MGDIHSGAWCLRSLFVASTMLLPAVAATQPRVPVVAVFGIEDRTGALAEADRGQLTDYLTAKIAEGGTFQVIPSAQLKRRLVEQKKESYQQCYDQQCQIEIGRELAANKSLTTQAMKVGDQCMLVSSLYDLRRAATEASASTKSACTTEALISGLEQVAEKLKEQVQLETRKRSAVLSVQSDPPGAAVALDGTPVGNTPAELSVNPGSHTLSLAKEGHQGRSQKILIQGGEHKEIRVTLEKAATPGALAPAAPAGPAAAPKPPSSTPVYKRWWFWTLVGVAAAGAGVGLGLGLTAGDDPHLPEGPPFKYSTFQLGGGGR